MTTRSIKPSTDTSVLTPSSSWIEFILAGFKIAMIGGAACGLTECIAASYLTESPPDQGGHPIELVIATVGKATVTHTLLWVPVISLVALMCWLAARRRPVLSPESMLSGLFILLAAAAVLPTALELVHLNRPSVMVVVGAGVLTLVVAASLVTRVMERWLGIIRVRRAFTAAALAVLVTAGSGVAFVRSPLFYPAHYRCEPARKPHGAKNHGNVLWIVLDTARADRMSCHGYPTQTTPFLDEWAQRSIVFDRTVANGIWTVPSHASMFTGLSVREHGMDNSHLWLDDDKPTVAEQLLEAGYATALFSNNPWLSPSTNLTRGFETIKNMYRLPRTTRLTLDYSCERHGIIPFVPWLDNDSGAALTNYLVGRWLDGQAGARAPVFVFVNYMEAHLPYRIPRQYCRMFMTDEQVERSYELRWRAYGRIVKTMSLRFNIEGGDFMRASDIEILKLQYLAAIRYLDDRVRELIEMFDQRGLLESTLVIIASDHGEYLDTHGMWAHRYLAYEDVAHVSLMVREPGRTTGLRITTPVQPSDLYPTVLKAMLNRSAERRPYGSHDLLAVAADGGRPRMAITEYNGPTPTRIATGRVTGAPSGDHRDSPQVAVNDGRYKYMVSADGRRELYDLAVDYGELHNLIDCQGSAGASPSQVEADRFASFIHTWRAAVPRYQPRNQDDGPAMDPEIIRSLKSLGYLGGSTDDE